MSTSGNDKAGSPAYQTSFALSWLRPSGLVEDEGNPPSFELDTYLFPSSQGVSYPRKMTNTRIVPAVSFQILGFPNFSLKVIFNMEKP